MPGFVVRWLISALGLAVASWLVPGFHIEGAGTLVVAAALLGFVNAVVRPLVIVLTFPLTLVTLGLFLLVVNASMLGFVSALLPGFWVNGFFPALGGWFLVTFTGWIASSFVGPDGRYEVLIVRRTDSRRDAL